MARVMVTDTYLTNIGNAIRSKNGTNTTYKPSQMAAAINNINTGVDINGVIEQYKVAAGETISAGDFVRFVTEIDTANPVETVLNSANLLGSAERSVLLPDGRVLQFFRKNDVLYAMIITINGTTMTASSVTQLTSLSSTEVRALVNPILLNDGRVFIAYQSYYGSSGRLIGGLVTINGNSVTMTSQELVGFVNIESYYSNGASAILLPTGKIFISYSSGQYRSLNCCLVTINGNTITKVISTIIGNAYCDIACGLDVLNDTDVLMVIPVSDYLAASIIRVNSNQTITKIKEYISDLYIHGQIGSTNIPTGIKLTKIEDNNYFLSMATYNNNNYWVNFKNFFLIDGNKTRMNGVNTCQTVIGYGFNNLILKNNKMYIIGTDRFSESYITQGEYSDDATKINLSISTGYNFAVNAVVLPNGNIFGTSNGKDTNADKTVGVIVKTPTTVKRSLRGTNAVAITGGSAGSTIDVYVPQH